MIKFSRSPTARIAQYLMIFAALAATAAGISAIANVTDAPVATKVVETWRLIGFFTFAGLFGLLAAKPTAYKGIWEIVILNKLALTIVGLLYTQQAGVTGTSDLLIFDGGLTVLLLAAYVLSRNQKEATRAR